MNKIEVTIDMKDDHLQFSSFETHIKASTKAHSVRDLPRASQIEMSFN